VSRCGAMGTRGIHHVAVAVQSLREAEDRYGRLFGAQREAAEQVPDQGVEALGLRLGDGGRVELLAPLVADSPVGRFLERRGEGLHHVAYLVGDLDQELARLAATGVTLIDETPRRGLYGRVAFIHPESVGGVLTELVEQRRSAMAETTTVRFELAFRGGASTGGVLPQAEWDRLQEALRGDGSGVIELSGVDQRWFVRVDEIAYVRRYEAERRLGFGPGA
jgi:methylmalonyl-CoA/ethylmalonyl-CoA epimerase